MSDEQTNLHTGPDAADEPSTPGEEIGFTAALEEIESILSRIEGDEVDLDDLATELGRAARMLDLCRDKIRRAEREVEEVSSRLVVDED